MTATLPVKYEIMKKSVVLDKKVFNVCEIREKEVGRLRRKFIYIHFNGNTWNLLVTNPDLSKVKYYQLE